MNFLKDLFARITGRKREEEKRSAPAPVSLQPQAGPAPAARPLYPNTQIGPAQPQPQAPSLASVTLERAQGTPRPQGLLGGLSNLKSAALNKIEAADNWIQSGKKVEAPVWDVGKDAPLIKKIVPGAYNLMVKPAFDYSVGIAANTGIDVGQNLSRGPQEAGNYRSPVSNLSQRVVNMSQGQKERPQDVLADAGEVGFALANILTLGKAGQFNPGSSLMRAAKGIYGQTARQGAIRQIAKENAKVFGKWGAAQGGAEGLSGGREDSVGSQAAQGGAGAVVGGAAGGLFGALFPYAGKLGSDAVDGLKRAIVRDATNVAPGIKSVNPSLIQQAEQEADNVIATLTSRPENPNMGRLNEPVLENPLLTPQSTIEEAQSTIPALQRTRQAQVIEQDALRRAVPGARTMNDLTGRRVSAQDLDLTDMLIPEQRAAREASQDIRPISEDIRVPRQEPESPTLYHGSDGGKLKVDDNGNINIAVLADDADRFGSRLDIPTSGMNIRRVSDQDLFRIGRNPAELAALREEGVDVLLAPNQGLAINPQKFSEQTKYPLRPSKKTMTIEDMMAMADQGGEGAPRVVDNPAKQPDLLDAEAPRPVPVESPTQSPIESPTQSPAPGDIATPEVPVSTNPLLQEDPSAFRTAKSGEKGKSKAAVGRGQEYDVASREAAQERGRTQAANVDYESFVAQAEAKPIPSDLDADTAKEMLSRYKVGTEEHRRLSRIARDPLTESAQRMALADKTTRKAGTSDQITNRFAQKVYAGADDNTVIGPDDFTDVARKNDEFVAARDAATEAQDRFNADPSESNMKAFVDAFNKAEDANRASKFEEYQVAKRLLEKSKNEKSKKVIDTLAKESGVYMMDAVDASLLSSTRTMLNNFLNTLGVGMEEQMFGKAGARLAKMLTGESIGGGSRQGAKVGAMVGDANLSRDVKLRRATGGNALVRAYKNVVTTGNTLGERNIEGATYSGIYDHYYQSLKKAGFSGDELKRRTLVNTLTDPENVTQSYREPILAANALGGMTSNFRTRFESQLAHNLSFGSKNKAVQTAAKLLVRLTVGFPTVVWRSTIQGGKRALLGLPSWGQAGIAMANGDKAAAALAIKNAVKEGGSGAGLAMLGYALASGDRITGRYPSDPQERARWEREGLREHAIRIGKNWYDLPPMLGSLALPFIVGANLKNELESGESENPGEVAVNTALEAMKAAISTSPVDSFQQSLDLVDNFMKDRDISGSLAKTGAGAVRAITPAGSFLNQVAKMIDPTANDLKEGEAIDQFVNRIIDGIPGASLTLNDKMVDGKPILNPGPIARLFGAAGRVQDGGVERTKQMEEALEGTAKQLKDYGVFNDNVSKIVSEDHRDTYERMKAGRKVDEKAVKALLKDISRGVTDEGETRFLSDGDYDGNLSVLKVKLDILKSDPATRQENIDDIEKQIRRGEVYKARKTPYSLIKKHKKTSLSEWRDMGDGDGDNDNPEMYQALWELDKALADANGSRNTDDPGEQFYSAKKPGKGRGRSGVSRTISGNTVGSPFNLGRVSFDRLSPVRVTNEGRAPQVAPTRGNKLIRARKISVSNK